MEVVELSLEEDVREGVGSRIGREGRLVEKRVAQQVLRTRVFMFCSIPLPPRTTHVSTSMDLPLMLATASLAARYILSMKSSMAETFWYKSAAPLTLMIPLKP